MKRRCIYCGKVYDDELTPLCIHCNDDNDTSHLTKEELHHLHQNAHNQITKETDRFNAGMVALVTGTILLILGLVFLFLSFKYNVNKVRVFRPVSVEFISCIIMLVLSTIQLVRGSIKVIKGVRNRRFYQHVISSTAISSKQK